MYRVCGLRLGPKYVERLTAEKNFYLRLPVEKMNAFVVLKVKIYNHMAVATLQLRLTVPIQK